MKKQSIKELLEVTQMDFRGTISPKINLSYEEEDDAIAWSIGDKYGFAVKLEDDEDIGELLINFKEQIKDFLIKKGLETIK